MANHTLPLTLFFSLNLTIFNETETASHAGELVTAYSIITTCGFVGTLASGLLLTVVIRLITTRNSGSQILVANLVLTYLLTSIFMASQVLQLMGRAVRTTIPVCRGILLSNYAVYAAGMWTDVCLGVNRVVAIFYPHHYTRVAQNKLNYILAAMCWVISICLIVPMAFDDGANVRLSKFTGQCEMDVQGITAFALFCLFTVFPYSLVSTASAAVIVKSIKIFRRRKARVGDPTVTQEFRVFRRRLHVARMLFTSFSLSSICQLPSFLAYMFFKQWILNMPTMGTWFNLLLALEFVGNPVSTIVKVFEYCTYDFKIT